MSWISRISRLLPQSANAIHGTGSLAALRRYCFLAPLILALATAGCGGSGGSGGSSSNSSSNSGGLQKPAPAGAFNTYIGTSPFDSSAGESTTTADMYSGYGVWSASFDHSTSIFNVVDVTITGNNTDPGYANVIGSFQSTKGFLDLTQTNDPAPPRQSPVPPAGYVLEIPARVAVLRQGDSTIPITALVPNGCPSIAGKTQFNFVILPTDSWASATDAAYGSVSIATSGANWTLASYQLQTLAGTPAPGNGTALPAGTCAPNAAGTAVYLPSNPLSISLSLPLPQTIAVGPSGFYIADQGLADGNTIGNPGEFGVIQPSSALLPSDILSANYLGFIFEPGVNNPYATLNNPTPESQMASFGPTVPAGQLLGGGFPNDDPTQPVIANLSIDLGAQSTTANGVFPDALVTNANSTSVCPDGITTPCPYSAVAVVGNAEGKFSIFIIGEDGDNFLPFGIYLFQQ